MHPTESSEGERQELTKHKLHDRIHGYQYKDNPEMRFTSQGH